MNDTTASATAISNTNPLQFAAADESAPHLGKRIAALVKSGDKLAREADELCDEAYAAANDKYISAGQCLKELRKQKPRGVKWEDFVKEHCGLSKQRASEIMRIVDGKTTVAELRAKSRNSSAKHRQNVRHGDGCGTTLPSLIKRSNKLAADLESVIANNDTTAARVLKVEEVTRPLLAIVSRAREGHEQVAIATGTHEADFKAAIQRCVRDLLARIDEFTKAVGSADDVANIIDRLDHIATIIPKMRRTLVKLKDERHQRESGRHPKPITQLEFDFARLSAPLVFPSHDRCSIADGMIHSLSAPADDKLDRKIERAVQRAEDRRSPPPSDPEPYFVDDIAVCETPTSTGADDGLSTFLRRDANNVPAFEKSKAKVEDET